MQTFVKLTLVFVIGLAGGLLGASLMSGGSTPQPGLADSGDGVSVESELRTLKERVIWLEREAEAHGLAMEDLNARVISASRRETGAALVAGEGSFATPGEGGISLGDLPTGPGFDAMVDAAIDRREEVEQTARETQRAKQREERLQKTLEQLTADLGLDAKQASVVEQALRESTVAREGFFEEMREGGSFDRDAARSKMTEIRTTELAAVKTVLSADQLEKYSSATDFSRGFGGRSDGGGGAGAGRGGEGNF
jgi:hypothetical protein